MSACAVALRYWLKRQGVSQCFSCAFFVCSRFVCACLRACVRVSVGLIEKFCLFCLAGGRVDFGQAAGGASSPF